MALKDKIIDFTISQFEGGKVNNKHDRGGLTNFGITKPFLAWYHGTKPESIHDEEITGMDRAEAITIYDWAYDQYSCGAMPFSVQHIYWDMCVNHGRGNAVKIMQRAVTLLHYNVGAVDGKLGANTIGAIRQADQADAKGLLNAVVQSRLSFYRMIVDRDPSQRVFLKGWTARAQWFLEHALVQ